MHQGAWKSVRPEGMVQVARNCKRRILQMFHIRVRVPYRRKKHMGSGSRANNGQKLTLLTTELNMKRETKEESGIRDDVHFKSLKQ